MSKTYTVDDVRHLIPETLTAKQASGIEAYLNEGAVPPADPCTSCDPNVIRKYINRIQKAEAAGTWPPAGRIDGVLNEIQRAESPGEYTAAQPGEVVTDRAPRTRKTKAE